MTTALSVALLLLAAQQTLAAKDLGSLLHSQCPEWGQISAECYKNQLNDIIGGVAQGVPALGIPRLEPFVAGPLNVTVKVTDDQSFTMSLHRMTFTGLSNSKVSSLKIGKYDDERPDEFSPLELTLGLSKLRIKTPYSNEGRFILYRATGQGHLTFTFTDVLMKIRVKYGVIERDGERFAQVHSSRVQVGAGKSNINVDSLGNDNEVAKEMFNAILSASSDQIFQLIFAFLNQEFSKLFLDVAQQSTANLPLSKVFKPWQEPPSSN
ncbi:uncharacterized protein LOC132196199 [Neocloeon triangulifer]|uniref:uncharacterized protein LOC132196199 n=1 Tax=Neocloeon triangulifer TaxID=2078957 RepID=UPI00286FA2AD|nr:uncharacterized protein LOC132196199 [Neocloeon triangulifer]